MFSTCFEPDGSSSGRRLNIRLWYGTFYKRQCKWYKQTAYADACKTYHTITVYTTVYLKMHPLFRNM
jgi:hypothetical protein